MNEFFKIPPEEGREDVVEKIFKVIGKEESGAVIVVHPDGVLSFWHDLGQREAVGALLMFIVSLSSYGGENEPEL